MKSKHTTTQEFKAFCVECDRLIVQFGLTDWSVKYLHVKLDANACCTYNSRDLWAELKLSTTPCDNYMGAIWCARHEVGHLLTAEMADMSYNGEAKWRVDTECERLANRFANGLTTILEN